MYETKPSSANAICRARFPHSRRSPTTVRMLDFRRSRVSREGLPRSREKESAGDRKGVRIKSVEIGMCGQFLPNRPIAQSHRANTANRIAAPAFLDDCLTDDAGPTI